MYIPADFIGPNEAMHLRTHNGDEYQKRISGPLLDRIDIHIEVPRVDYEKLSRDRMGEPSECIRALNAHRRHPAQVNSIACPIEIDKPRSIHGKRSAK